MNKNPALNSKEQKLIKRFIASMIENKVENISVYEIYSGTYYKNDSEEKGRVIGHVVTRTDQPNTDKLQKAFAEDFCYSAFGLPIHFQEENSDNAIIDWWVQKVDIKIGDMLSYLDNQEIMAVAEPMNTDTPYFGSFNHFAKNSLRRSRIHC